MSRHVVPPARSDHLTGALVADIESDAEAVVPPPPPAIQRCVACGARGVPTQRWWRFREYGGPVWVCSDACWEMYLGWSPRRRVLAAATARRG